MKKLALIALPLIFIFSCKKEKTETPVDTTNTTSNAFSSSTEEYIKYDLGGTNYSLTRPANGAWSVNSSGSISSGHFGISKTFMPAPGVFFSIGDTTSTPFSSTVSDAWFRNFLTTKNYIYKPVHGVGRGVYLSTKDNSNANWYTVYYTFPAYQSASTFTIVDKVEYTENNKLTIKFKATFSCKMYNSAGDSLLLTNGEMITSFYK